MSRVCKSGPDDSLVEGEPGASQGLQIAAPTLARGRDVVQVAQEGDAPMTVGHEVQHRILGAGAVLGDDAVGIEEPGRPIHEHHGQPRLDLASAGSPGPSRSGMMTSPSTRRSIIARANSRSRSGSSSRLVASTATPRRLAASPMARWMAEEKGLAMSSSSSPDGPGAPVRPPQAGGRHVVAIVELFGGLLHPTHQPARHAVLAVDDARHRLDADPGERRDIVHRRPRARDRRSVTRP